MSSGTSMETAWKVEMVLRFAGLASMVATGWYIARKMLPLLEIDKESEDSKSKVKLIYIFLSVHGIIL